jgi:hypothetical protein
MDMEWVLGDIKWEKQNACKYVVYYVLCKKEEKTVNYTYIFAYKCTLKQDGWTIKHWRYLPTRRK